MSNITSEQVDTSVDSSEPNPTLPHDQSPEESTKKTKKPLVEKPSFDQQGTRSTFILILLHVR